MTITTSYNDEYRRYFDQIQKHRPELTSSSSIAKEAVRWYADHLDKLPSAAAGMSQILASNLEDTRKYYPRANESQKETLREAYRQYVRLREYLESLPVEEQIKAGVIQKTPLLTPEQFFAIQGETRPLPEFDRRPSPAVEVWRGEVYVAAGAFAS